MFVLGSGDNLLAEEYLKDIEENDIKTLQRQNMADNNMWIWEDPNIEDIYKYHQMYRLVMVKIIQLLTLLKLLHIMKKKIDK